MGLWRGLLALLLVGASSVSVRHSLLYQYVVVSEPNEGLPQFFTVGYLDDQIITYYDSRKKKKEPKVSWMEEVEKEDANYWKEGSEILDATQQVLQEDLRHVQNRYKQNGETPKVTVTRRKELEDGMETHICHLHGFYPREIDASWTRDGEVWLEDTFYGSVAPNVDGTYHYWLSVRIDPKERDRYRCHVEHDSLQEPLDVALKVPESNMGLLIGCIVLAGLTLVCLIAGILVFHKKHEDGYKAATNFLRSFPRLVCLATRDVIGTGFFFFLLVELGQSPARFGLLRY
ncbi:major histocompatibility complex class I-related gene protein-like isoform X4 [Ahaetulla prasina]|uniref:major histocompatibility complex class I-related gene protein-like isoform X4 n=1 Tax=Ahaetulla prasina TaxID=499056 RepID=UPI0026470B99|nr:major histocompatibility complex class I-related gene protein-like isoform X4 [Ahaetulla prasina]